LSRQAPLRHQRYEIFVNTLGRRIKLRQAGRDAGIEVRQRASAESAFERLFIGRYAGPFGHGLGRHFDMELQSVGMSADTDRLGQTKL